MSLFFFLFFFFNQQSKPSGRISATADTDVLSKYFESLKESKMLANNAVTW